MTVKMIIATGINGEIGYSDGRLAFECPEDMKYFREQTTGHNVVMGKNTWNSLPFKNGLPDRVNHVVTRNPDTLPLGIGAGDVEMYRNLIPLFEHIGNKDTWIIGGAQIYSEFLDMVDEIHHSVIAGTNEEADVFFDMHFLCKDNDWSLEEIKDLSEDVTVYVWKRKEKI